MPDATPLLALPLLAAAQAQKHVTHNEALVALDSLVQLAVLDKDLAAPPASPAEGDRYLVAAAPTGAWAGWAGRVVRYQDGAWRSFVPKPGWFAFVADEADLYTYTGAGGWMGFRATLTALQNLARLGIGTTADAANPFAAKLNAALWTARGTGEGGTGDLRYTLNKEGSGRILSLLLQSGWSGRAELGLIGDDDLTLKVSADGGTWREALRVARASGALDLAAPATTLASAATVDIGSTPTLRVGLTGSAGITSFGTVPNRLRYLHFTDAMTLVHNPATLSLIGGANIVTAVGDTALLVSGETGNWRMHDYCRSSGKALAGPAAAEILDASASGRSVLTGTAAQGATALGLGTSHAPAFAGVALTGAGGTYRSTRLLTNAAYRWEFGADSAAESGSNSGSNFYFNRYSDNGSYLGTPFGITRSNGSVFINNGLQVSGPATFNDGAGAGIGSITIRCWGDSTKDWSLVNNNGALSLNRNSNAQGVTIFGSTSIDGAIAAISANILTTVTAGGFLRPGSYTVATVPAGVAGAQIYVSNARKPGEASGAGTGVTAYYSNGNWRRLSDDSAIAA